MYNLRDDKCILYSEVLRRCSNLSVSVPLQSTVPLTAFFLSGSGGNGNSGYLLNSGILRPMSPDFSQLWIILFHGNVQLNSLLPKLQVKFCLNLNPFHLCWVFFIGKPVLNSFCQTTDESWVEVKNMEMIIDQKLEVFYTQNRAQSVDF